MRETTASPFTLPKRYLNGKLGSIIRTGEFWGKARTQDPSATVQHYRGLNHYNEKERSGNQTKTFNY